MSTGEKARAGLGTRVEDGELVVVVCLRLMGFEGTHDGRRGCSLGLPVLVGGVT